MAGSSNRRLPRLVRWAAPLVGVIVFCWIFPLFHITRLPSHNTAAMTTPAPTGFDARTTAEKFWSGQLIPAMTSAAELARVVQAVRANPESARKSFGKPAGVGVHYFFIHGRGNVVAQERNVLRLAVDGAPNEIVELRIGPIFGNAVRDGTGRLDVNAFPGLQEFNALAAELNALVEKHVLPPLREKARVGATIQFVGCTEAPEWAEDPGEPLLTIVPVQAEVR